MRGLRNNPDIIALIRQMAECESPSDDPAALDRFVSLMSDAIAPLAKIRKYRHGHLRAEFAGARIEKKRGQILGARTFRYGVANGDSADNAVSAGERPTMGSGRARHEVRSGVFRLCDARDPRARYPYPLIRPVLQLNADEEVGSTTSRALTEDAARRSHRVLVLEPGTGLTGKIKTARKGTGSYRITVHGKASHAGVDFEAGASAIVELARQIERVAESSRTLRRVASLVNPGVVSGGTRSNVVAAEAQADVDIRIARLKDAPALDRKFRALRPIDKRCRVEVTGGLNRPPMERSSGIRDLFGRARDLAREISVELEVNPATGGGSDGNFTAAPGHSWTLDGLGGVGEGAHALNENILVRSNRRTGQRYSQKLITLA